MVVYYSSCAVYSGLCLNVGGMFISMRVSGTQVTRRGCIPSPCRTRLRHQKASKIIINNGPEISVSRREPVPVMDVNPRPVGQRKLIICLR